MILLRVSCRCAAPVRASWLSFSNSNFPLPDRSPCSWIPVVLKSFLPLPVPEFFISAILAVSSTALDAAATVSAHLSRKSEGRRTPLSSPLFGFLFCLAFGAAGGRPFTADIMDTELTGAGGEGVAEDAMRGLQPSSLFCCLQY